MEYYEKQEIYLSIVKSSCFESSIWLDMGSKSQLSSFANYFLVNNWFVKNVIDWTESIVIGCTNGSYLKFIKSSISEEIGGVGKHEQVGQSCGSIKSRCSNWQNTIHSVVLWFSTLCVKHKICHGIIWISVPVSHNILITLIGILVHVTFISFDFMCVN